MSLSAGLVKVLQMPQEVQFFERAGLGITMLILLGAGQIVGSVLTVLPKFRKPGATIIATGFLASSIVIFMTGDLAFAAISLLPVVLTGVLFYDTKK